VDLSGDQKASAIRAALQHFLLNYGLSSAYNMSWPDVSALNRALSQSGQSLEPGVAAAAASMNSAMFRAWYLAACKLEQQQQHHHHHHLHQPTSPTLEHTASILQNRAHSLAASFIPVSLPPDVHIILYRLFFLIIKLRLLVGSLQSACPNLQATFQNSPGAFNPGVFEYSTAFGLIISNTMLIALSFQANTSFSISKHFATMVFR